MNPIAEYPNLFFAAALLSPLLLLLVIVLTLKSNRGNGGDQSKESELNRKLAEFETENRLLKEAKEEQKSQSAKLEKELSDERTAHQKVLSDFSSLQTLSQQDKEQAQEKIDLLKSTQENLKLEFENLANKILEEKSEKFTQQNKNNIDSIMSPLKEQISEFKKKVEDTYDKESKERVSLQQQIIDLQKLNNQLSEDASNLTNALKGDSKLQGNWGELVLERILEQSGLAKGREYQTQESFSQAKVEGGQQRYQPDVLIHLPENKTIVLDSKVSLTAYERFCSEQDEGQKQRSLKEHIASIRKHVNELADKNYQDIKELYTLDFVVMFMPIEAAFLIAMQEDGDLYHYAMSKNIFIVSPSNLLVMLRTIQHAWKSERQNQHALDIADRGGKLYDKFVGFVADVDAIGNRLGQTQESLDKAMNKLKTGPGNLIRQAEQLKTLGAKANKSLPSHLLEESGDDSVSLENLEGSDSNESV